MSLIVTANLTYSEYEGRYTFKVDGDNVTMWLDNTWVALIEVAKELLVEVWFQCANHNVKRAIEALGLV